MNRILKKHCAGGLVVVVTAPTCFNAHPDTLHDMTWIVDEPPADWVMPIFFDFGDGTNSISQDGEDAHEYDTAGTYNIIATDAEGRTCGVPVAVPH
jgi:hypothetical protein